MAERYFDRNGRAITAAFDRLRKMAEEAILNGMYGMLNAGLDYLHEAHEPQMRHENENDTLGWAIIHDGRVLEAVSQARGDFTPRGDALARLQDIASTTRRKAWVGVVLSDMANGWYRLEWEMEFLQRSADEVRANFSEFFKPIAR